MKKKHYVNVPYYSTLVLNTFSGLAGSCHLICNPAFKYICNDQMPVTLGGSEPIYEGVHAVAERETRSRGGHRFGRGAFCIVPSFRPTDRGLTGTEKSP